MSNYRLISGFLIQLLNGRQEGGANRTGSYDLAKGAERAGFLRTVEVGSTLVLNLADRNNFVMMVKDFGRNKLDFTGKQHTDDQGAYPELVPTFSRAFHLAGSAL